MDDPIGNPSRLHMPRQGETVDNLGVFSPNQRGVAVVVPANSEGALGVPGITNIASMPSPNEDDPKARRIRDLEEQLRRFQPQAGEREKPEDEEPEEKEVEEEGEPEEEEPKPVHKMSNRELRKLQSERMKQRWAEGKMDKQDHSKTMKEYWARRREERKAANETGKRGPGRPPKEPEPQAESPQEEAARAIAAAHRASQPATPLSTPPPPVATAPPAKPAPQLNPKWASLVISLPDMSTNPMDEVEIAIIKAREQIDHYSKEAQRLKMSSMDRTCAFCGKVVEDGRWYSRECPVDPNGRVMYDRVFCSQPCHVSWVVQNQGQTQQERSRPEMMSINFKYR